MHLLFFFTFYCATYTSLNFSFIAAIGLVYTPVALGRN
jgi:hypothetical protein